MKYFKQLPCFKYLISFFLEVTSSDNRINSLKYFTNSRLCTIK